MTTGTRSEARVVELSHGKTRYFEVGEGTPVLLLHGVGYVPAAASWLPVMERLADAGLRLIAPDFVGWGPGDGLDQHYSFAYLADFVRDFQDALGIARSHVVGHSMGGWIASILAYESPARVDRLGLVASGGVVTRRLASMTEWQPPTATQVRDELAFLSDAGIDPEPFVDEALSRASDAQRLDRYRRVKEHMSVPETRHRYNTVRRLERTHVPTLVLWGDEDAINHLDLGERTRDLLPDGTLVVCRGAGHFLPQERPEVVAQHLDTFLPRRS